MRQGWGKSAAKSCGVNDFTGLLVLRGSRGKSAACSYGLKHLPRLLVLHRPEQDSTEVTKKISPHDAEGVLRQIPGQLRERRREYQWQDDGRSVRRLHAPALHAMGDEVIRIPTTPGGLRLGAPSDLTRRHRTGTLTTTNASVRYKPAAADPAGPLREHP